MKTNSETFNTGDSILDEMLDLKHQAAAAQDFDLARIADASRASQRERGVVTFSLHEEASRKFKELQALSTPRR